MRRLSHTINGGFGDTQSIAIGIQSNRIVGSARAAPRNQRRTPSVVNTAFYPSLMWNGRLSAPSGDPFNNADGYPFPRRLKERRDFRRRIRSYRIC